MRSVISISQYISFAEAQTDGENLKVKFLTQKQCDLQKKIEHLESENQKLTDQCQMKDGEVN